jgi:hypothetical protein
MSRPWLFALLFVACAALLLWRNLLATPSGQFSAAVTACGATYMLTYLPFNVSAEYRYFYWCGFAAWLGLLSAAIALFERPPAQNSARAPDASRAAKIALAAIAALVAGSAAVPADLPATRRVVVVSPADRAPVLLTGLASRSTPPWMGIRFEGRIEDGAWTSEPDGFAAGDAAGPLVATLNTLHQTVRLRFRSGPGAGRVTVETDGRSWALDTAAESIGEVSLDLPPPPRAPGQSLHLPAHQPAASALLCVAILAALLWLSSRKARS